MSETARIFAEVDGKFYVCDNKAPLDTRGAGYNLKVEAMQAAVEMRYTHAIGSGTCWSGVQKLPGAC